MEPYQAYLNIDLLEAMPKSGPQRQQIMKRLSMACVTGPGLRATIAIRMPRFRFADQNNGRLRNYVLLDDAAKSVMVVDIRWADR